MYHYRNTVLFLLVERLHKQKLIALLAYLLWPGTCGPGRRQPPPERTGAQAVPAGP
jgi:hypothetical protein